MSLTKEQVIEAAGAVAGSGAVRRAASCDGFVSVLVESAAGETERSELRSRVERAVRDRARALGARVVEVSVEVVDREIARSQGREIAGNQKGNSAGAAGAPAIPGVRHVIAVGAGKGGVGKSTVSVNLAVALARAGHAVGLLDGDIYGPSVPTLLGLTSMETLVRGSMLQPFFVHGVKTMTIGKLVDPEKPLIWRGPMAHGAFKQLVEQTQWGELDYLIIDLPPGTGDVSLTMAQMLAVSGAVIVCTPQKVAQDDAVRAARMFQALHIPVLGVVENMSYFVGDDGKTYDLFGRGGAERMAQRLGLPFLGSVPISMALRQNSDAGNPTANFAGAPELRTALEQVKDRVEQEVALAATRAGAAGPVLRVS